MTTPSPSPTPETPASAPADATGQSAPGTHGKVFTPTECAYLAGQPLARLATTGPDGGPQVRPVGFVLNDDDTLDIGGPTMRRTQKYRNAQARPEVSLLIDDMAPADDPVAPGWGRGVEIRGRAELLTLDAPPMAPDFFSNDVLRVHPCRVIAWHLEADDGRSQSRDVG
ncbi:PPOX class F420-dependent oxidoreductase [Streptomyces tubercidicus]|uniref:PPOX class F420-dependent oxidoreductase n=1 Tax=Streptomyces tubercidicus TaxID=47759 RepID=A0A640UXN4_9ACTN|nr:PPOX class F420-dependent oxidoreductase [Streptomyces tubercidicus]WAU13627.1 PPOX class F420-dependent oxidoreductase [Streptomyces tubercidicus]GFE39255.1 PPOX class F420-dependent oxidoreductase [Streptomyces tubercidicus]